MIEILTLKAVIAAKLGRTLRAFRSLERALQLAKPAGYVRIFLDEGEVLKSLLQQLIQAGQPIKLEKSLLSYMHELIAAFPKQDNQRLVENIIDQANEDLIDPLTERELQVLQHMALGNSYEQVARKLFVAPSTVRWHVKNIFQKLNVHNGIGAIAVARELKILH